VFEGHRFCEDGVPEPAPGRRDTWFFSMTYARDNGVGKGENLPDIMQQILPNPFKDFLDYARTFHPTSLGHTAIKDQILRQILQSN
jgi:hypothetical protein